MQVRDLMSERVIHVSPDTGLHIIAAHMRDGDLGSVPVSENDKLIGMVTDRDMVIRGIADATEIQTLTARDVMSEGVKYCYEDEPIDEVLENMASEQIRRLPVVNREKRLVGIVSLGDLAKQGPSRQSGEALGEISKS